jgi:hypothetical protein
MIGATTLIPAAIPATTIVWTLGPLGLVLVAAAAAVLAVACVRMFAARSVATAGRPPAPGAAAARRLPAAPAGTSPRRHAPRHAA